MGSKVMFTTVADKGGSYGPFAADTTLIFDKVISNIGDGYDANSGNFTAPFPGYYYFAFSYQAGTNSKSGLTLMKNGVVIVSASGSNQKGSDFAYNAGNSAGVQLEKGDKVSVRLPAECKVSGLNSTTSFSGFLISQV